MSKYRLKELYLSNTPNELLYSFSRTLSLDEFKALLNDFSDKYGYSLSKPFIIPRNNVVNVDNITTGDRWLIDYESNLIVDLHNQVQIDYVILDGKVVNFSKLNLSFTYDNKYVLFTNLYNMVYSAPIDKLPFVLNTISLNYLTNTNTGIINIEGKYFIMSSTSSLDIVIFNYDNNNFNLIISIKYQEYILELFELLNVWIPDITTLIKLLEDDNIRYIYNVSISPNKKYGLVYYYTTEHNLLVFQITNNRIIKLKVKDGMSDDKIEWYGDTDFLDIQKLVDYFQPITINKHEQFLKNPTRSYNLYRFINNKLIPTFKVIDSEVFRLSPGVYVIYIKDKSVPAQILTMDNKVYFTSKSTVVLADLSRQFLKPLSSDSSPGYVTKTLNGWIFSNSGKIQVFNNKNGALLHFGFTGVKSYISDDIFEASIATLYQKYEIRRSQELSSSRVSSSTKKLSSSRVLSSTKELSSSRVLSLPSELQFELLKSMPENDLINFCLTNHDIFNTCIDPYLGISRGLTGSQFKGFKLKLIADCKYKECSILRRELENEILNNPVFMNIYSNMFEYGKLIFDDSNKVNMNDMLSILAHITEIEFYDMFNQPIDLTYFPNATKVTFGKKFDQLLHEIDTNVSLLPHNLTHLDIDGHFNQPVDNLPDNLYKLKLFGRFNQRVDNLPKSLKILEISGPFYYSLDHLPELLELYIESSFNSQIHHLSDSLTHLTLGWNFNQLVDHLPNSITHLTFGQKFNQLVDKLPNSITHLTFGDYFDIQVDSLPNSITHLTFGWKFNQKVDNLPNSITHLTFGQKFKQSLDKVVRIPTGSLVHKNVLPNSIIHLTFGRDFNQSVDNLPNSITHLTFGWNFNQLVDKLPNSITHLTFGYQFNKLVDKLPNSITHLTFGQYFNQKVEKLPNSITHLTFGQYFNQKVEKLPNSITHLTFGLAFNQSLDKVVRSPTGFSVHQNVLPNSITYLTFGHNFNQSVDNIPNSITHLTFGRKFNKSVDKLPNSITHLTFGIYFDKAVDNLPNSITHLTFGTTFNKAVDSLPHSITHLTFGMVFNKAFDSLPNSITHLTFGMDFNKAVDSLPNSITNLTFGCGFNKAVDNLPNSITHLTFGSKFNQPVDKIMQSPTGSLVYQRVLPNSITHLTFGHDFNQSVDNLPNSITHLTFGTSYYRSVDNLPNSITHLTFGFSDYFDLLVNYLPINLKYLKLPLPMFYKINKNLIPPGTKIEIN